VFTDGSSHSPRLVKPAITTMRPSGAETRRDCDTRRAVSTGSPTPTSTPGPSAAEERTQETPASRRAGLKLVLPILVILVILGGVTLLLVGSGGTSKPALPGNAAAGKTARFAGLTLNPVRPAPPLDTLRNYNGAGFDLSRERGKAVFVTFLYAHCPDVCPLIASDLHAAYASMSPTMRGHVAIVAVSVDPHGDTAGTVAAFVRQHGLTGEASYLIGSADQLVPVWKAWNVGSEQDTSRPELVNHSALIYGIGASGKLLTIYPANVTPGEIAHDAPMLLAQ
jgi:protein SCO1